MWLPISPRDIYGKSFHIGFLSDKILSIGVWVCNNDNIYFIW